MVARAWADPAFKARLLSDPEAALAELGYSLPETTPKLDVVENTDVVHHLVVCTLCSCYPGTCWDGPRTGTRAWPIAPAPVVDPRGVVREFGLELSDDMEVRVLDSTADLRYLVLPRRPRRHGGDERGGTGRTGHPRQHDWRH